MSEKRTVLVVDDQEDIRIFLQELLSLEGYDVLTATNGKEALKVARAGAVDCFVMDIDMPVMNGIEAFRQIKADQRYANAPFLFVTGNPDVPEFQAVKKSKYVECIPKPLNIFDILRNLQKQTHRT